MVSAPPLSQGAGYGVVIGLGTLFAVVSAPPRAVVHYVSRSKLTHPTFSLMWLGRRRYLTIPRPIRRYLERR